MPVLFLVLCFPSGEVGAQEGAQCKVGCRIVTCVEFEANNPRKFMDMQDPPKAASCAVWTNLAEPLNPAGMEGQVTWRMWMCYECTHHCPLDELYGRHKECGTHFNTYQDYTCHKKCVY